MVDFVYTQNPALPQSVSMSLKWVYHYEQATVHNLKVLLRTYHPVESVDFVEPM